jgi:hypothetical protein
METLSFYGENYPLIISDAIQAVRDDCLSFDNPEKCGVALVAIVYSTIGPEIFF